MQFKDHDAEAPGNDAGACCAPTRDGATPPAPSVPVAKHSMSRKGNAPAMVALPSGTFQMGNHLGDGYPGDGETPVHAVEVDPFLISPVTVTNSQFSEFVIDTGYRTEAENFGWSFVFAGFLPARFPQTRSVSAAPWWRQVFGATWDHPEGPQSDVAKRADHPVTHVSWNDAMAFCAWSQTRLPTEGEWEYAARGGSSGSHFWWGDELTSGTRHRMNVWQGTFPTRNSGADGYKGTAPVRAYQPNGYGLYNMTGNVWEWCADWFDPAYYQQSPVANPPGAATGTHRVMRGGSYLCHKSYCNRYRVDARSATTPDSSTGNIGFRVVRSRE